MHPLLPLADTANEKAVELHIPANACLCVRQFLSCQDTVPAKLMYLRLVVRIAVLPLGIFDYLNAFPSLPCPPRPGMEEVFSLKDFEKSCLIQSLLWISVNWVTWQVFEREVKTALHLMQYMFNKCGDLETGVCGFCRHWNTICEKSVQRAFGFLSSMR